MQTSIPPEAKASVGLGLRRGLMKDLQAAPAGDFDFLEVAPENWIGIGGAHGAALRALAERYPLSCHGSVSYTHLTLPTNREV